MIGKEFGKYEIIRWLGGGSFGDVYLAKDKIIDKEFAIKVSRLYEKEVEILKKEARILSELEHPNIVRFYSIDIIENKICLVMEYVDGESLRKLIEEKKLEIKKIKDIIIQVLDALSYAHKKGFLHRDIKPENILIDKNGNVKITDFGLGALFKGGILSLSFAGTPIYLAPEGWEGKYLPQTDIFGVGCILYEMLTGEPPFKADNFAELKYKIEKGKYPPLPFYIPKNFHIVIKRALEPDISKRYSSCENMKEDLLEKFETIQSGSEIIFKKEFNIFENLTEEQKEIIKSEGTIHVWGGAGCGKTTCLARKVAYLIKEKNVPPENILVLTFAGKTLRDLREKISKLLSKEEFINLNRNEQIEILRKCAKGMGNEQVKAILEEIQIAKAHLLTPSKMEEIAISEWQKFCAKIYKAYQKKLKELKILDYDDILFYANEILKKYEDVRKRFSEKYTYIFVDEFQDINPAEFQFILYLSSYHKNLYVTGDEDQAIYGFRGARGNWMREFEKYFPECKKFRLTKSFRLPEKIYIAAQNLIKKNKDRENKIFITIKKGEDSLKVIKAENENEEAKFILNEINSLLKKGANYSDIAIITRTISKSRKIEEILIKGGMPYNLIGKSGFYTRKEVKALISYLEFLVSGKKTFLNFPLEKFLLRFEKSIPKTRDMLLSNRKIEDKYFKNISETIKKHLEFSKELSPYEILKEFLEVTEYLKFLKERDEIDEFENINELLMMSKGYKKIREFIDALNLSSFLEHEKKEEGVFISTVHGVKGLEFKFVFISGLYEGSFPISRALSNIKEMEEERRLFYVALTRATERVYLIYPLKRFGIPQVPSRFIEEIFIP
ncbi:MAG: UvrD-helicase domain-containing protein [candidate division WOR-3 bacterium]